MNPNYAARSAVRPAVEVRRSRPRFARRRRRSRPTGSLCYLYNNYYRHYYSAGFAPYANTMLARNPSAPTRGLARPAARPTRGGTRRAATFTLCVPRATHPPQKGVGHSAAPSTRPLPPRPALNYDWAPTVVVLRARAQSGTTSHGMKTLSVFRFFPNYALRN